MEVCGENGSKLVLRTESMAEFGRGLSFTSKDRTVSRRHILFKTSKFSNGDSAEPRVSFEVIGRNPVWIRSGSDGEIRAFRQLEKGEMAPGDSFCIAGKQLNWFNLKRIDQFDEEQQKVLDEFAESSGRSCDLEDIDVPAIDPVKGHQEISVGDDELADSSGRSFDLEDIDVSAIDPVKGYQEISVGDDEFADISGRSFDLEDIDVSAIDPVKEFGFLVLGHEFDCYGDRVIRNAKKWNWFLEETRKNSEDDEDYGRKGGRRKRKKGAKSEDEDWTDENEDAVEIAAKTSKVQRPKYSTRSKDDKKSCKEAGESQKKTAYSNRDDEEDEDDETLGGFVVDDEEDSEEHIADDEEEEEFSDGEEED